MEQNFTPLRFIHKSTYEQLPFSVKQRAKHCLLDLIGIAIAGSTTRPSSIIHRHSAREFGGVIPIAFDSQTASPSGVALALGMTIDSLAGHDGFNPSKGHIGCGVIAALLSFAKANPDIIPIPEIIDRHVPNLSYRLM
jgi:2-methylcitrate dehydratase PrpD